MLFTLHTAREGGKTGLSLEAYLEINQAAAVTGWVGLIDVEVLDKETIVTETIESAHTAGVEVVGSNRQFDRTSSQEETVDRLRRVQELGADTCKIAVVPQNKTDVIRLSEAIFIMRQKYAEKPLVIMSMAELEVVGRTTGEISGSALTFGTAKKASAPGQVEPGALYQILQDTHKVL